MKSLNNIFKKLNLTTDNGLFIFSELKWKGVFSQRIEKIIEEVLEPDAFFVFNNKPFILFYDNPLNTKKIFEDCWNFNESPVIIINESNQVQIYNGFSYLKKESKEKSQLVKLADERDLNDFEYFNIVTGKTWKKYQKELAYKNRVDYKLLENIKDTRDIIVNDYKLKDYISNNLIGRIIFIRYLIDRKVIINNKNNNGILSNDEFCKLLQNKEDTYDFFRYLNGKFNGDLFPIEKEETRVVTNKVLSVIIRLLKGEELKTDQLSLFDIFDFSIIPIEFISNVYEFFIGTKNQEKKGAYYTPLFLVDYILTETIDKYFENNPNKYNCKVLDPACGSGIFLVETLRKIITQYEKLNPDYHKNNEHYKSELKRLVKENIFGVDKDPNAINIAIFSIYITLLDNQEPKEIENFKFPPLLNSNFFVSDFFNTKAEYNSIFKETGFYFDFILGNPPWKRGTKGEGNPLYLEYIKTRQKEETKLLREKTGNKRANVELEISNKEIAQAFVLRVSDFSSGNTKCSLIVTSKMLYNISKKAKKFRKYLLEKFYINSVFEMSSVRREVFDKSNNSSIAPPSVLFYNYANGVNTGKNIINHIAIKPNRFFSLFKVFTIQRNDYKKIAQEKLIDNDWLWKVLVYGSYPDYNFIKRLKKYKRIKDKILSFTQGITVNGEDNNSAVKYIGMPYIITKDIDPFYLYPTERKWQIKIVHRNKYENKNLFLPHSLLIAKGIDNKLNIKAAISDKKLIFTDSISAIKAKSVNILKSIMGIYSTDLIKYINVQTASSIGVEREQLHNKEKLNYPYFSNPRLVSFVSQIENIKKEINQMKQKTIFDAEMEEIETKLYKLIKQLDNEILIGFQINEQEKSLIDYATNITIPLIMRHKGYEGNLFAPIKYESDILKKYAQIFISRFSKVYNNECNFFEVEIWWSNHIIGMFFNVIPKLSESKDQILWKKNENLEILAKISSLGYSNITDQLFLQKDIRGFEKKSFYIIKPNEKKQWHNAIAYFDLNEFVDAILKSGRKANYV